MSYILMDVGFVTISVMLIRQAIFPVLLLIAIAEPTAVSYDSNRTMYSIWQGSEHPAETTLGALAGHGGVRRQISGGGDP